MQSLRVHVYLDRLFFGESYWRIHKEMDKPFKVLGRGHRILFHDPAWAYIIASRLYRGDSNAVLAAQYHIIYDEICSRDPQFRKNLEMLAMLSSGKKKRKRKRKRVLRF